MEKVGPITPQHTAQNAARTSPVGKGWVMEPLETGFLLRALALGAQVHITPEDARALRDGQITPENLAARHGVALPPHLPGSAVTVAFSEEAKRLAGTGRDARAAAPQGGTGDHRPGTGIPLPGPLTLAAILAAIAILALALAI